jgi:hypothetical protein
VPAPKKAQGTAEKKRRRTGPKEPAAKEAREQIGPELTQDSFVTFVLAMMHHDLARAGKMEGPNTFLAKLAPRVQERFEKVRRCTFSWMTDSTSLALAAKLRAQANPFDLAEGLRLMVLAQVVTTSQKDFDALADKVRGADEEQIRRSMQEVAGKRKSLISNSLRTGSMKALGLQEKGSKYLVKAPEYIASLEAAIKPCLEKMQKKPAATAAAQMQLPMCEGGLNLPGFRAHCVGRFLWFHSHGTLGTSPDSCFVGSGAEQALNRLCPPTGTRKKKDERKRLEEALAAAVPIWTKLALAADDVGVIDLLDKLGLRPTSAQTWEHLLCEARKVFGLDPRPSSGKRNPHYAELFHQGIGFYNRLR